MENQETTGISIRRIEEPVAVSFGNAATNQPHGIPQTDEELTRAFVLKSHSEETRRTYRTTLQTFARFCEMRHGGRLAFSEVTFTHVTEWRDFLIKEGRRSAHDFHETRHSALPV